jgi:hypothetical protein
MRKICIEDEVLKSIEYLNISLFEKNILKIKNLGEKVIHNLLFNNKRK